MKAVVAAFNQEKALGAFSVITNLRMDLFEALDRSLQSMVPAHKAQDGWYVLEMSAFGQIFGVSPSWVAIYQRILLQKACPRDKY